VKIIEHMARDIKSGETVHIAVPLTRQEIEKRMDELARKYVEKRDPEIIDELYNLRLELKRLDAPKT
jgi:FKBP-type peptidyl-prolyl cis-trans isomerase (trigger factor)